MKTPKLISPTQIISDLPDYRPPAFMQLNRIKKGNLVQVGTSEERFWVDVTSVKGRSVQGKITNDLCFTNFHGLKQGDDILFGKESIYKIEIEREEKK